MTSKQSTTRLALYVTAAVLTSLLPDIESIGDVVPPKEWAAIFIKASLAGVVTARAYIDKSLSQVK